MTKRSHWAREIGVPLYGPVALVSDAFEFTETDYYAATMGPDLKKQFLAFERLIDPAALAESNGKRTRGKASMRRWANIPNLVR